MSDIVLEYIDKVIDYLEYLGYPAYVIYFSPKDVAKTIYNTCIGFQEMEISYRTCALSIFGMTWTYQIARVDKNETIN